jgi:hypothetical protein
MSVCRTALCTAAVTLFALTLPTATRAVPVRGSIPWDFIACSFSDTTNTPFSWSNLQTRLLSNSAGSLAQWISTTSYGTANLNGVTLRGYYTINETAAQGQTDENNGRGAVYSKCQQAAANGSGNYAFNQQSGRGLSVITWPGVDTYGSIGESMDGADQPVAEFAHELGHGLGLNHSWSNDYKFFDPPGSTVGGDYDNQWDEMSYGNVYTATAIPDNQFGGGPGLDGYRLDFLGWLPMPRVVSFGADGVTSKTVTLAALNQPSASGYLLVRVPVDPNNPLHYFTLEYVTPTGFYSGIPGSVVLINEVTQVGVELAKHFPQARNGPPGYYTTFLERVLGKSLGSGDGSPDNFYHGPGFDIVVKNLYSDHATVHITDTAVSRSQAAAVYGPNTCVHGYVWRAADDLDYVCVSPSVKGQAQVDNGAAAQRHLRGSRTCVSGFVWRSAFPGDYVCVFPSVRAQAAQDNANTGTRYVIPLNSNT